MPPRAPKNPPVNPLSVNPVQTQDMENSFWEKVSDEFKRLEAALDGLNIPTPVELERYWASLTAIDGEIQSNLRQQLSVAFAMYPGNEERQDLIRQALSTVHDKAVLREIEAGIEKASCSPDFFWAWTIYQSRAAVLFTLVLEDESAVEDFNRKSAQKPAIVQRYIYAHWMYERWAKPSREGKKLQKDAFVDAQEGLVEEIQRVLKNEALKKDEEQWLNSMVEGEGDNARLKGKIILMTAEDICNAVENGAFSQDELPPLSY